MIRLLVLALLLLTGCKAPFTAEEVQNAVVYFPPRFKSTERARFCFSAAERQRALQEYTQEGANTLFEFVIDETGTVKKARLVRTTIPRVYHGDMVDHARVMKFSPDTGSGPYRAFFFPTKYRYDATFEWL